MKQYFIIGALFILLIVGTSCERNDIFGDGNSYNSIVGWFSADKGVTLSGSSLIRWDDRDGRGTYLYNSSSNYPVFNPINLNNLPTLTFGASTSYLENSVISIKTPMTIMIIMGYASFGPIIANLSQNQTSIAYDGSNLNITPSTIIKSVSVGALTGIYKIFTIQFTDNSRLIVYANKSKIYDEEITEKAEFNGIYIGTDIGLSNIFNGDIVELILFNTSITENVREKIVTDLMEKYGLQ
ncbi:MAG: hypothetical protein JW982_04625 [Spirochaetes bacterium]|nr:hypothetical protein [Spirochaetota bacterium]